MALQSVAVNASSPATWLQPGEEREWDEFVATHPLGLIYHTSAWQRVLQGAFPHIQGRFLVLRGADGRIQAGLPVYRVHSWLLKDRTVSVPFATICEPLVSSREQSLLLWPAIEEMARQNRSKRVEIRARSPQAANLPEAMSVGRTYWHHYIVLDKPPEKLLRTFHDSCIRRRMRKAEADGVTCAEDNSEQGLHELYQTMVSTRIRLLLPPMPFAFFQAMVRELVPRYGSIYLSRRNGKTMGAMLAIKYKGLWMSEYSGHQESAPAGSDQLLYWHVIQQAQQSGATVFSFGRTSLDNEGLVLYKRRWGTTEEMLADYFFDPRAARQPAPAAEAAAPRPLPHAVYSAARLMQYLPVNLQRTFGNFCYRHLG